MDVLRSIGKQSGEFVESVPKNKKKKKTKKTEEEDEEGYYSGKDVQKRKV